MGPDFDAAGFRTQMPPEICGEVLEFKRNVTFLSPYYWRSRSETITDEDKLRSALEALICEYKPFIHKGCLNENATISIDIVVHFGDATNVHGFWFSRSLVEQIADIGAEVNIDAYLHEE